MSIASIIFSIIIGAGCVYYAISLPRNTKAVNDWPQTLATITKSSIDFVSNTKGYTLKIDYQFEINGKHYQSNKVYKDVIVYTPKKEAQSTLDKIATNPTVKYNPQDPTDCCLLTFKLGFIHWFAMTFGIVMSLFGWIALIRKLMTLF